MYRIMSTLALAGLFILGEANASKPMDDYEQKMKQAAQADRTFELPEEKALSEILSQLGMDYFLGKTGLHKKISNKQLKELDIYMAVNLAYADYYEYLKKGMPAQMLRMTMVTATMNKPLLIDAIIKASKEING